MRAARCPLSLCLMVPLVPLPACISLPLHISCSSWTALRVAQRDLRAARGEAVGSILWTLGPAIFVHGLSDFVVGADASACSVTGRPRVPKFHVFASLVVATAADVAWGPCGSVYCCRVADPSSRAPPVAEAVGRVLWHTGPRRANGSGRCAGACCSGNRWRQCGWRRCRGRCCQRFRGASAVHRSGPRHEC